MTRNVVATDGMTITGTLSGDRKVSIVDGATVTLDGVRINGSSSASSPHAGITCLGDANIILEGNNYVRPFGTGPAAIAYYKRTVNMGNNQYLPASYSFAYVLDISGDGTLNVGGTLPGPQPMGARLLDANISYGGAGLGAGVDEDCGDLVINGGTISATGGNGAAGIGGAHGASSGSIEILGGTVNATGGDGAAGIGSGDDSGCGDITISGATVTATAGANATPIGAGAGGGPVNVTLDGVSDTTSGSTRIIVPYEDLGALTDDLLLTDGMTICGTLAGNYKVSIADGATVTLSDVTINGVNSSSCLWAGITCEGDATIILSGANTVKGFYSNYPGIHVPTNHTLTIKGSGSLDASSNGDGAGIGGGSAIPCGNIVIRGGTITAQGGTWAAGIGGGHNSGTSSNNKSRCGTISILGGHVTATGGSNAAGIGTGRNSCCGDIVIAPGVTVIATKGSNGNPISTGSAIGHGMLTVPTAADGMSDTTVDWTRTIRPLEWDGNLATLTRNAIATDGMTIYNTLGGVYKVSIAAGATVTLSNAVVNLDRDSVTNNVDYSWAGINCLGDANIILAGTSTVSGFYKNYPGIHVPAGSALTIDGSGTLNAIGTDCGGAGIGGGWEVNCGNIVIAGGKIVATGADSVPGIGVGSSATGGVITISGGNVTATGGMGAAGIGSGLGGSTCGDITITGGIVDASGGPRAAGIGRGASAMYQDGQWYNSTCGDISIGPGIVCVSATGSEGNPIRGNGAVTVDSSLLDDHGYPTRVITAPGAWDGNLATLTHNAIATDGMTIYNTLGGIYKVSIADGATVTLSNAVINLDRDSVTNNPSCRWAGVNCVGDATLQLKGMSTVSGFYLEYPGIHVPEDSTLTINGSGALNAIGTDCGGAGIGGGCYVDCGNIVIAGGNIVATGANSVPGIGVGSFSTGGDITITGGNVTATAGIGAAGIGSGMGDSTCGDITITGGTVDARGGPRAPGIGSGVSARYEDGEFYYSACGDIYIGSGIVCVSATSGGGNPIRGNGAVTVDSGLVDRTSADGMTRTITAAGNTAFLPGDRTTNAYSTQGEAETAAASIQIVAPADVQAGLSSGDLANYLGCFTKKVVQNPAGEGYVVVVALTEQAEETLQEQADDDVADEILPAITGSEVTVTTTPGFYYSVKWGDEPDCSDQTIPVLATGTSLALELPKGENPAATFYKLVIDFTR